MGTRVIASNVLANGLRTEFVDTYEVIRNRQLDGRLAKVMDLGVGATNREHDFAYFNASPHMTYWERGTTIPTDAMDSVTFNVPVYEWGRRIPWSKWDRKDDQTDSLMTMARTAGASAALLPERMFFDILNAGTLTLPAVPNAPDGVDMFHATDGGGGARFDATGGNTIAGGGVTTAALILADFYKAIVRFKQLQDGKGQPMFDDSVFDAGFVIIYPLAMTYFMESAFLLKRGVVAGETLLAQDAGHPVELWGSARLTDVDDWYIFLANPPKPATFFLDREGVQEYTALEGDNNSDSNRSKAEEYIQWESRSGAGVALPYAAMEITN